MVTKPLDSVIWVPDERARECADCKQRFTQFRRKVFKFAHQFSSLMHPLFFKILRIELENSNFQTSVAAVFETNAATLKE